MNNYLPTDYQSFIHTSRYARWLEEEGRRENWDETVQRTTPGKHRTGHAGSTLAQT